ncbi:hypothetical protein B566_EDAN017318 [Ephemera danica]|nr:hypothetical protein B566_EDAN017318 [Ephemera danica]
MWDYTEEVKKWSSAQVMTMYEKSEEDKLKFKCLDCNEFFKASVHPRSGKFIVSNLKKHLVTEELKGKKFKPPSGFEGPTSDQNLPSAQDVDPVEKRNPAKAALKPKLAMAGTGKRASGEVNNAVPGCSGLGTGVQSQQAVALESASGSDNSSVGRTSQPDKHLEKLKSEHTRFDSRQRLLMEPCGVSTKQAAASVCPLHSVPPGYVAKTAPLEEVSGKKKL